MAFWILWAPLDHGEVVGCFSSGNFPSRWTSKWTYRLVNHDNFTRRNMHCTLISFTILIPASQPVCPAGRFGVIWPAGRFRRIWPAGRFRNIWPAGRFRKIWPAGRFRKIWPAAGFCSKRSASVHTLHMSKPNVTRVQSATQWTASVHTLHMSKPNVTRVQSAT